MATPLHRSPRMLDVVVIGGGPAGLSGALVLGRCRRRVLVCDAGRPRNAAAQALHGYLTRDGLPPGQILRIGREGLHRYGVELRAVTVTDVVRAPGAFEVKLETGERLAAHRVLVATGVRDHLPEIDGLDACFGTSASRDMQFAIVAAAEGAKAAVAINKALQLLATLQATLQATTGLAATGTHS